MRTLFFLLISTFCYSQNQLGLLSKDTSNFQTRPPSGLSRLVFVGDELRVQGSSGNTIKMQKAISVTGPITKTGETLGMAAATTSTSGYLTASDYTNFKKNFVANTVLELRTITGIVDGKCDLLGYYSKGDGGGQQLYWDATSTETDNGGSIFQVTGVITGRWKSKDNSKVDIRRFGAKTDGTDATTALQRAIDSYGYYGVGNGGEVLIPKGEFVFTNQIYLRDGTILRGDGQNATTLTFTGTGTFLNGNSTTGVGIQDLTLFSNSSTSEAVLLYGNNNSILRVQIKGGVSTGWQKGVTIKGGADMAWSFNTKIKDLAVYYTSEYSLSIEHAIETFLADVSIFARDNNTTNVGLIINTGVSGVYATNVSVGYGLHSLHIKNTITSGTFPWNQSPIYLFFTKFIGDTATGGDGILFDGTLGTNILSACFVNSWAAYAGVQNNGTITVSSANGITIAGGKGIIFQGRVRLNAAHGVAITSSNVSNVTFHDSFVTCNNFANNSTGNGIDISANVNNIFVANSQIGNVLDAVGYQKYGVKISSTGCTNVLVTNNSFMSNLSGEILNSSNAVIVFANTGVLNKINSIQINGLGEATNTGVTDSGAKGAMLYIQDTGSGAYSGGQIEFGSSQGKFAAIKSMLRDGGGNTKGDIDFQTRNSTSDAYYTSRLFIQNDGKIGIGTITPTTKLQVVGLPTYSDNTAATSAGLTAGAFYRTSTGVLMVVY